MCGSGTFPRTSCDLTFASRKCGSARAWVCRVNRWMVRGGPSPRWPPGEMKSFRSDPWRRHNAASLGHCEWRAGAAETKRRSDPLEEPPRNWRLKGEHHSRDRLSTDDSPWKKPLEKRPQCAARHCCWCGSSASVRTCRRVGPPLSLAERGPHTWRGPGKKVANGQGTSVIICSFVLRLRVAVVCPEYVPSFRVPLHQFLPLPVVDVAVIRVFFDGYAKHRCARVVKSAKRMLHARCALRWTVDANRQTRRSMWWFNWEDIGVSGKRVESKYTEPYLQNFRTLRSLYTTRLHITRHISTELTQSVLGCNCFGKSTYLFSNWTIIENQWRFGKEITLGAPSD